MKINRRIATFVITALGVLTLGGGVTAALTGGSGERPVSQRSQAPQRPPVESASTRTRGQTVDQAFVAAMTARAHHHFHKRAPLAGYGHWACSELDAGLTRQQAMEATRGDLDDHDASLLVDTAVTFMCPQHLAVLADSHRKK